jgi:hypothetical protein
VEFVGVDELQAAFLNESRTSGRCLVPRTGNPGPPYFLQNLSALMNCKRLSSMKAAQAAVAWCRVQEIRVPWGVRGTTPGADSSRTLA